LCLLWRPARRTLFPYTTLFRSAGDLFALARIDEAEVQEMDQQHLPMNFHVLEQALPVNFIIRAQDQVGHVGAIIAVTVLDEALGPDQFRRAYETHRLAKRPAPA